MPSVLPVHYVLGFSEHHQYAICRGFASAQALRYLLQTFRTKKSIRGVRVSRVFAHRTGANTGLAHGTGFRHGILSAHAFMLGAGAFKRVVFAARVLIGVCAWRTSFRCSTGFRS